MSRVCRSADCNNNAESDRTECSSCRWARRVSTGSTGKPEGRVLVRESEWDGPGGQKLTSRRYVYPTAPDGPAWPVVQPAAAVTVSTPAWAGPTSPVSYGWKRAVILPDVQIPYQDEDAVDVALQIVRAADPDLVVWLGDFLDLPEHGKYRKEPRFAQSTQGAIDYGHALLAKAAACAPNATGHVLLAGNHEARLTNYLLDNAAASFGIRRANVPEEWPVMSVPYLLRTDELGVHYEDAYPAGEYWINENLRAIHGTAIGNANRTASQIVAEQERVSTLFGHTHKQSLAMKTRAVYKSFRTMVAASPGCLCRIDGTVPGMKSATDSAGRVKRSIQDWQQGVAIVEYQPGDGLFSYEPVLIHDGWARFRGQDFFANKDAA